MDIEEIDLKESLSALPPVRRAAYSDRTAALMATLAELAYEPFDEESNANYVRLAGELISLRKGEAAESKEDSDELLQNIAAKLRSSGNTLKCTGNDNEKLRDALAVGGFELKGVFHEAESFVEKGLFAHDTQGFVACRPSNPEQKDPGLVVVVFRGTKEKRDWLTNINFDKQEVESTVTPGRVLGHFHKGFYDAYKSVEPQMEALLADLQDYPIYVTGHSLGGALAAIATWYLPGSRLAACYTFGAPRCGDKNMAPRYRTPIYRVVHGADPVPFVPPSGKAIDVLKGFVRLLGTVVPLIGKLDTFLIDIQKFRHYGDQRYLPMVEPDNLGDYPRFQIQTNVNPLERMARSFKRWREGGLNRPDKYHNMSAYRRKLKVYSEWRQKGEV